MKKRNIFYLVGITGLILNLLLVFIMPYFFDTYFASIFTFFFPVWIIIIVVGWRKAHPRK